MTDHIYGRINIIESSNRPNMFIEELNLYIDVLAELPEENSRNNMDKKRRKYLWELFNNLEAGILYYKTLVGCFKLDTSIFLLDLFIAVGRLETLKTLLPEYSPEPVTAIA